MEQKIENALMAMGVYAEIAKRHGKAVSKVERGIRYAFAVARSANG